MKDNALYDERVKLLENTVMRKPAGRVPVHSTVEVSYAIQYCNLDYRQANWSPEVFSSAVIKVLSDFCWDSCDGMFIRPAQLYRVLGAINFVESSTGYVQHPEVCGMHEEDYEAFISNPLKCIVENVLPRLYKNLGGGFPYNMYNLCKGAFAFDSFFGSLAAQQEVVEYESSVPVLFPGLTEAPFDYLGDQLRGFTNMMMDIRRCPQKVLDAVDAALPIMIQNGAATALNDKMFPGLCVPLHLAPYMNIKQFEKFYWPSFKKLIEGLVDANCTIQVFYEQNWERYFEYLTELPRNGKLVGMFEFGDMKKAKNMLSDVMCIQGFYPLMLLGNATKEQCIDKAKEVLDVMAPGGGYIFSTDKCIINKKDAKLENLRAVTEYVRANGSY